MQPPLLCLPLPVEYIVQSKNWGMEESEEANSTVGIRVSCMQTIPWAASRQARKLTVLKNSPVTPPGRRALRELMLEVVIGGSL
jgi:hypothetical protein